MTRRRTTAITRREPLRVDDLSNICTRVQREIIYGALRKRLPISRAADMAGVTATTLRSWLKRGMDRSGRRFYFFRKKVMGIITKNEQEALETIRLMQRGGFVVKETKIVDDPKWGMQVTTVEKTLAPKWTAAAWWLERHFPEEYARQQVSNEPKKAPEEIAREINQALQEMDDTVP